MSASLIGTVLDNIPDLPGRWTVWSKASDCPGAYFVVPTGSSGGGYAVIKATQKRAAAHPELKLIRREIK